MADNQSGKKSRRSQNSTKFTFNLPNLTKLDLSYNKLTATLNLYTTFSLCPKLTSIDLNSNRIERVLVVVDDTSENSRQSENNPTQLFLLNDDEEKARKHLNKPKNKLDHLLSINLSHNRLKFTGKGGFLKMLCEFYELAPNLTTFVYDQSNGVKLVAVPIEEKPIETHLAAPNSATAAAAGKKPENNIIVASVNDDEDFCFEYSGDVNRKECLREKLRKLNLSNNNLSKVPAFVYELRRLSEMYFDGNLLRRIPNEMYKRGVTAHEVANFQRLKHLQMLQEREKRRKEREENGEKDEDDEEEDEDEDEVEFNEGKKKKKKKTTKKKQKEALEDVFKVFERPIYKFLQYFKKMLTLKNWLYFFKGANNS
jgi:Leucine-rich repeat (LRR) protein